MTVQGGVGIASASFWVSALAKRGGETLSTHELDLLNRLPVTLRRLRPRQHWMHVGDQTQKCAYLLAGVISESRITAAGTRQIVGLRLAREFVGLSGIFLDEADRDTQALTDCVMVEVGVAALRHLLDHGAIRNALIGDALVGESIAQEWMINIGRRSARVRVAHLLCELVVRMELADIEAARSYVVPLKQHQIADATGLHRVAVNRALRELAAENILSITGGRVTIRDMRQLEEVADFSARYLHLRHSGHDRRKERRPFAAQDA
ncbi:Crp/Fnr family transcriptional regulator [uncultured Sphingomonas sp.]|uniref:Crp/Fnr family transcriptional regulator n=1 Tax=uncultured Sphingomonas sp. TaxID=158754 RepID=UPI002600F98A|nr:Crp/Fnr family transcriptional regulator [uncultured Sphingomonas sp.]